MCVSVCVFTTGLNVNINPSNPFKILNHMTQSNVCSLFSFYVIQCSETEDYLFFPENT